MEFKDNNYKELIEFLPTGNKMEIILGINEKGTLLHDDLNNFSNTLITGTTGAGKSNFLHNVIITLISRNNSEELKLVLIDPKNEEFFRYKNIPHLLCPIIKGSKEVLDCFDKLNSIVEGRLNLFKENNVDNLEEYNESNKDNKKLPKIVALIDEFADLILNKEYKQKFNELIETSIRVGLIFIIATQNPMSLTKSFIDKFNTIITGILSTEKESLLVLGTKGAESLKSNIDMLIKSKNNKDIINVKSPYVSNDHIQLVLKEIKL